jgi:hypothetical protein
MKDIRVLIHEARGIVHLIVYHDIEILLAGVGRDIAVRKLFRIGHCDCVVGMCGSVLVVRLRYSTA